MSCVSETREASGALPKQHCVHEEDMSMHAGISPYGHQPPKPLGKGARKGGDGIKGEEGIGKGRRSDVEDSQASDRRRVGWHQCLQPQEGGG
jgi:hypothetical protein